jgi:hypothetical protein
MVNLTSFYLKAFNSTAFERVYLKDVLAKLSLQIVELNA